MIFVVLELKFESAMWIFKATGLVATTTNNNQ